MPAIPEFIMAFLECKFYSDVLGLSTSMSVVLPQKSSKQSNITYPGKNGKYKTLFLLHGLSDDHSIWMRRTSIERYAASFGIAVVMPEVGRSFYSDMLYGGAYETFVAQELPAIVRAFFPLSDARQDNYIAGLSMGGYGAFKFALNYPENYCAAASLSGALDMAKAGDTPENEVDIQQDLINIWGNASAIANTKDDLFYAAKTLTAQGRECPKLYMCCGDADFLYHSNLAFRDFALQQQLPLTWQIDPGYAHTWDYWDLRIQTALAWMFNGGNSE